MGGKWELIDASTLASKIEDANLGIRNTTAIARLGVRLVLAVAVATGGTATHCEKERRQAKEKWKGERKRAALEKDLDVSTKNRWEKKLYEKTISSLSPSAATCCAVLYLDIWREMIGQLFFFLGISLKVATIVKVRGKL